MSSLRILITDLNLFVGRVKACPPQETFGNEFAYFDSLQADVLIIRETNRDQFLDGEKRSFPWIFAKYLPSYQFLGCAKCGDQSEYSFGISVLVKKDRQDEVSFEDLDISAYPLTNTEKAVWSDLFCNRVPLLFWKGQPRLLALHSFLCKDFEVESKGWIWEREIENVKRIVAKYATRIDVFADANMITREQKKIWKTFAQEYAYKHVFGTDANLHFSFCAQPWDLLPRSLFTEEPVFGFSCEKGDQVGIRSAIDGALSEHDFCVIYPDVVNGKLRPFSVNISRYDTSSLQEGIAAFSRLQEANQTKLLAAFDHVSFLVTLE